MQASQLWDFGLIIAAIIMMQSDDLRLAQNLMGGSGRPVVPVLVSQEAGEEPQLEVQGRKGTVAELTDFLVKMCAVDKPPILDLKFMAGTLLDQALRVRQSLFFMPNLACNPSL